MSDQKINSVMIKSCLKQPILKKLVLVLVISTFFIGPVLYLTSKKLDENGICWVKGRALSDEELYQNAMQDFVQNLFDDAKLSRGDREGSERAEASGPVWCKKLDCDVWIAPSLTYSEIERLRDKFAQENVYATKSFKGVPELLNWHLIESTSQAGYFKQKNNQFSIVTTIAGKARYYTIDCCEVYTVSDWQKLRQEYTNFATNLPSLNLDTNKYLLIKPFYVPEIDIHYDGRDGPKYLAIQQYASIYALNSCGQLHEKKQASTLKLLN